MEVLAYDESHGSETKNVQGEIAANGFSSPSQHGRFDPGAMVQETAQSGNKCGDGIGSRLNTSIHPFPYRGGRFAWTVSFQLQ